MNDVLPRSLRHRAPALWLLLPFVAGLVLGRQFPLQPVWLLVGAVACSVGALLAIGKRFVWLAAFCAALTLSAASYYQVHRARISAWDSLPPREANVTLRIERTYAPSRDGKRISGLARVVSTDSHLREIVGQRVYFSLNYRSGDALPTRSSEVRAVGVLQTLPRTASLETFDGYLANTGTNFRLTRGRLIEIVKPPTRYRAFCAETQQRLAGILGLGLGLDAHPHLVAISRAMLLGLQQELSEEQTQWFMRSGTMHLFSISGLHIGVIAVAMSSVLSLLRLPRLARFVVGTALLWLYVDITGAAPSAVRAFIMVALLQLSFVLRLPVNPIATLALAGVVALVINPMQLFTASFQMSYGIVAALLLLGLPLADYWKQRWQLFRSLPKATWTWWQKALTASHRALLSMIAVGLATTLVSTISGVIYFRLFTPGSLVANLVLIPLGSLVILSGFVSLLCGLVGLGWMAATFNHAAALLLWVAERGIDGFVRIPGVYWDARFSSPWFAFSSFAALLATVLWGYAARWERARGGFWPPFAITALALLLGVEFG